MVEAWAMNGPLGDDRTDGWYHVTAGGSERRALFRDEREEEYFPELLEEMVVGWTRRRSRGW